MTTTTAAAQPNVRVNYKDKDYAFAELPRTAQLLLKDMMRLEQQVTQLQFELRHLQAAQQAYSSSLRKTMSAEETIEQAPDNNAEADQQAWHA